MFQCYSCTIIRERFSNLVPVTEVSTINAPPDDGLINTEICQSRFNVNVNIFFKTPH